MSLNARLCCVEWVPVELNFSVEYLPRAQKVPAVRITP
jgi:hypothetical protein